MGRVVPLPNTRRMGWGLLPVACCLLPVACCLLPISSIRLCRTPSRVGAGRAGAGFAAARWRLAPLVPWAGGRVCGGGVRQHRGEGGVPAEVRGNRLVEGVEPGVPGVAAVVATFGAEPESGSPKTREGGIVGPAAGRASRKAEGDVGAELARQPARPIREVRARADQAGRTDTGDPSGAVVLVEQGLKSFDDLGVIFGKGPGAIQDRKSVV